MLGVLRRRDFALVWTGGLVSVAGDWLLVAALPYYVYSRTGSTVATAAMTAAELAPGILLGSLAGVLVDRWDRRAVMVRAALLQALVVSALLVVAADGPLWVVYAVAAGQSAVAAFSLPAEDAFLPTLVSPEELVGANALNAANNRVGRLLGVAAGGLVLAGPGLVAVVLLDAATFLVAAGLMALVRAQGPGPSPAAPEAAESAGFVAEWRAGASLVRRHRTIATLFVVLGLMTFSGTMLDPLVVGWVRDVLHEGPQVYAGLLLVHSCAGILASVALGGRAGRLPAAALMGWGSVVAGVVLLVTYNVPVTGVALALGVVSGTTSVLSSVGTQTVAQQVVPESLRGRVFGSLNAVLGLCSLVGAGLAGLVGEAFGVTAGLDLAGGLVLAAGVVALLAMRGAAGSAARPSGTTAAHEESEPS